MKKWVVIILATIACIAALYGIVRGIFYLKIEEKSEREIWRITDYSILRSVSMNDLFVFSGYKADRSVDCNCVYATNRSTGEIIWSIEEVAKPYMSGASSSNFFSVSSYVEAVSPQKDIIYIRLIYDSNDIIKFALLAVRSIDGELLWKIDGDVDSNSFANSVLEKNQILVFDEQGDLLAINSDTGEEIWRNKIYPHYDNTDIWFSYHNGTVFTFDRQRDHKVRAFDAATGQPLWDSDQLGSGRGNAYIFNTTIYVVSPPIERDKLVTAIDLESGEKRWDMVFPDVSEFSFSAGDTNEVLFLVKKYEGGPQNFHKLAKLIVVDEFTGQSLWKFNENFSHGDLRYQTNNSTVYIGTEDGFVLSVDSTTGNIMWQTETKQFPIPFTVIGDALIVVYKENYLSVVDTKTGLQKWKLDLGIDESWSILGENIVDVNSSTIFVAGNYNRRIYAIDINTGTELWTWSHFLPARSKYEIQLIDNTLYVDQWSDNGWYYFALRTEP